MTTRETTALTRWTMVGKVISLLFNMLSRFVIAFRLRSKHLNFVAAVTNHSDFRTQENKSVTGSIVFPSICHEVRNKGQKWYGPKRRRRYKKRWQEYMEELYRKDINDPDNRDVVITHLESDILECKVKWALGSITTNKASGGNGIPVDLFQILKNDAVKVLHSVCQ